MFTIAIPDAWHTADWVQFADNAQQAFSSSSTPTLHHVLPTLEKLYVSWEKALGKPCYDTFVPALAAGMKLDTYYQQSAESDAHIMAMGEVLQV